MNDLVFRVLFVLRFIAFMAIVYLAVHMAAAPWIKKPGSKVGAFFMILTSPLTRPMRAFLGPGIADSRVRLITFFALIVVWLLFAALTAKLGARLT
ncbi:MAG: hypothetical protein M3R62_08490 [Acidobacteriota bacterium]|nr:hypothetical protein [Acidobacteriota bacterium]